MSVQIKDRASQRRIFVIPFLFRVVAPVLLVLGFLGYSALKFVEDRFEGLFVGLSQFMAEWVEHSMLVSDEQLPVLDSWLIALEEARVEPLHRLMTPTAAESWTVEHVQHLSSLLASDHGAVEEVVPLLDYGRWEDLTVGEPSNENRVSSQEWGIVYERGSALAKVKMTLLEGRWLIDDIEIEFKPMEAEIEDSRNVLQWQESCGSGLSP